MNKERFFNLFGLVCVLIIVMVGYTCFDSHRRESQCWQSHIFQPGQMVVVKGFDDEPLKVRAAHCYTGVPAYDVQTRFGEIRKIQQSELEEYKIH